jgi:hypothetical protein
LYLPDDTEILGDVAARSIWHHAKESILVSQVDGYLLDIEFLDEQTLAIEQQGFDCSAGVQ